MSPWGDILTEQLGGDILMEQQQRVDRPLDDAPVAGAGSDESVLASCRLRGRQFDDAGYVCVFQGNE